MITILHMITICGAFFACNIQGAGEVVEEKHPVLRLTQAIEDLEILNLCDAGPDGQMRETQYISRSKEAENSMRRAAQSLIKTHNECLADLLREMGRREIAEKQLKEKEAQYEQERQRVRIQSEQMDRTVDRIGQGLSILEQEREQQIEHAAQLKAQFRGKIATAKQRRLALEEKVRQLQEERDSLENQKQDELRDCGKIINGLTRLCLKQRTELGKLRRVQEECKEKHDWPDLLYDDEDTGEDDWVKAGLEQE